MCTLTFGGAKNRRERRLRRMIVVLGGEPHEEVISSGDGHIRAMCEMDVYEGPTMLPILATLEKAARYAEKRRRSSVAVSDLV